MQRNGRNLRLVLAPFCFVLATTFMPAPSWIAPASAGPLDGYKACNDKFGRENNKNGKENDALLKLIKKANNADMHKTDPVKYCDWHKKHVMPALLKNVRRMEALAKDTDCFNDPLAVNSYERLAQNYKGDERWLSGLCLGIQPY